MAATTEKAVDAGFIGHSLAGRGMLNFQKGTWYGVIVAVSQAYGASPALQAPVVSRDRLHPCDAPAARLTYNVAERRGAARP